MFTLLDLDVVRGFCPSARPGWSGYYGGNRDLSDDTEFREANALFLIFVVWKYKYSLLLYTA